MIINFFNETNFEIKNLFHPLLVRSALKLRNVLFYQTIIITMIFREGNTNKATLGTRGFFARARWITKILLAPDNRDNTDMANTGNRPRKTSHFKNRARPRPRGYKVSYVTLDESHEEIYNVSNEM